MLEQCLGRRRHGSAVILSTGKDDERTFWQNDYGLVHIGSVSYVAKKQDQPSIIRSRAWVGPPRSAAKALCRDKPGQPILRRREGRYSREGFLCEPRMLDSRGAVVRAPSTLARVSVLHGALALQAAATRFASARDAQFDAVVAAKGVRWRVASRGYHAWSIAGDTTGARDQAYYRNSSSLITHRSPAAGRRLLSLGCCSLGRLKEREREREQHVG